METKRIKVQKHLKPGETCWILENNSYALSGTIKNISGEFYTILLSNGSAIRLKSHRVYATREEAEEQIIRHKGSNAPRSPYDYWY